MAVCRQELSGSRRALCRQKPWLEKLHPEGDLAGMNPDQYLSTVIAGSRKAETLNASPPVGKRCGRSIQGMWMGFWVKGV
jgi:hypothetical protein